MFRFILFLGIRCDKDPVGTKLQNRLVKTPEQHLQLHACTSLGWRGEHFILCDLLFIIQASLRSDIHDAQHKLFLLQKERSNVGVWFTNPHVEQSLTTSQRCCAQLRSVTQDQPQKQARLMVSSFYFKTICRALDRRQFFVCNVMLRVQSSVTV